MMIHHFGRWLSTVVACLTLASTAHASPPANLLANGSFEAVTKGKAEGWEPRHWGGVEVTAFPSGGYKSKRCAMIASDGGANFSFEAKVPVEPFATYRLSGWIKTENVHALDGRGALMNVHDLGIVNATPPLTGTHDWTRVELVFQTFGQDRLSVLCCLGGWGLASGKAWFDDLVLQKLNNYDLDYTYLTRRTSPNAPRIAFYGGRTAIAEHAFQGSAPRLTTGKEPVRWRLVFGPSGMTVDEDSGAPSWPNPIGGRYRVLIEARNASGHDIMEFFLIVVWNDIPDGQVVMTKYMDFVLPPDGVRWFCNWRPHATLDHQFEYLRKLIGHEPTGDGKQIVKFQPSAGCSGLSGNPVTVGPGFWHWDAVGGWNVGIWFHEVGHNFNGQILARFYANQAGFGDPYHHHCQFLAIPLFLRTAANPAAFGLEDAAAENYRRFVGPTGRGKVYQCNELVDWVKKGGKARTYPLDQFHLWGAVCCLLASEYGPEVLEMPLRAMRTDGIPASLRDTAKTPIQINSLIYCTMSHAAKTDLRPFFKRMGYEFAEDYYREIDDQIGKIVENMPDEDDMDGWKKSPINGHYYRRTTVVSNWCAAEVEARQFGGHLATVRNAKESEWLQSRFGIYPTLWIGAFRHPKRHGAWTWISAERSRWTNWDKDQPAAGSDPTFVFLATGSGKWQTAHSLVPWAFGIIEADVKPPPPQRKEDHDEDECMPSASQVVGSIDALNDGIVPKKSNALDVPRFTWWDHKGTAEWVQYKFKQPTTLSAVEVYWFDDTGTGLARVPASWRLVYRSDNAWKPVRATSPYGVQKDRFNRVTFDPVTTTILRLEVQLQPNVSGGILEWKVE
jgi:hypothetical protein